MVGGTVSAIGPAESAVFSAGDRSVLELFSDSPEEAGGFVRRLMQSFTVGHGWKAPMGDQTPDSRIRRMHCQHVSKTQPAHRLQDLQPIRGEHHHKMFPKVK
jgi:hypothetical protein